ncbi:MAG: DNA polymerase III subunit chi [Alphaproteobacteria bacterium]|nr:DNA polymerase III subunit chi [Alphaproteobacteria bacterium]
MSEVRFYHLQQQSLYQALPLLVRKALDNGKRIVIRVSDAAMIAPLSDALWSYRDDGFIPHGASGDDLSPADQPVFITADNDNANGADMLILASGSDNAKISDFALCCEVFDGRNADEVQEARKRWKAYKDAGHNITYWQQTERGGWEQKA